MKNKKQYIIYFVEHNKKPAKRKHIKTYLTLLKGSERNGL